MTFTAAELAAAFLSTSIPLKNGESRQVSAVLADCREYAWNGWKARTEDSARDAQIDAAVMELAEIVDSLNLSPGELQQVVEQVVSDLLESGEVEVRITVNDGSGQGGE